jgi:hypothetical protein
MLLEMLMCLFALLVSMYAMLVLPLWLTFGADLHLLSWLWFCQFWASLWELCLWYTSTDWYRWGEGFAPIACRPLLPYLILAGCALFLVVLCYTGTNRYQWSETLVPCLWSPLIVSLVWPVPAVRLNKSIWSCCAILLLLCSINWFVSTPCLEVLSDLNCVEIDTLVVVFVAPFVDSDMYFWIYPCWLNWPWFLALVICASTL